VIGKARSRGGAWRATLCVALGWFAVAAICLSVESAGAATAKLNSADRIVFWTDCPEVATLSNTELEAWKARGIDGFVCQIGHVPRLGGANDFRTYLRSSNVARRALRRGLKMYLGFQAVNYWNTQTPLKEWFDNEGWSTVVLPQIRRVAATARRLGFAGLAIDQELYPQVGGATTASWDWDYSGNTHSEAQVRAKVRQRGRQLMRAMVKGFPRLELAAYDTELPQSWEEAVQEETNGLPNLFARGVHIDLWNGLSSVMGYRAIRLWDAIFYKSPQLSGSTWDTALQYNANRVYSLLSRRFSNWAYASSRLHLSPFSWIDSGTSDWQSARSPEYVADQLTAFRRWGTGGEFANFAYRGLRDFDYTPYLSAMRSASASRGVDSERPRLSLTSTRAVGRRKVQLAGFATDNFAIRTVRWRNDLGDQGVARLTWQVLSGDQRVGWNWRMRWSIGAVPVRNRTTRISIRAVDIKGLARVRWLTIRR
jgi:hypothetical protein